MVLWLLLPSSVAGGNSPQTADQTRSPHGNLNIACQNCHTVYGWKPIRAVPEFDHNQTKFPLRGLHENVNCVNCHTKMVFANVGNKCADCHADIHRGKMAAACETCHTVRGWKVSVTQINMHMNRFPLTGAHAAAACDDCHKSGALAAFNNMSTECISCHAKDFNGTTNPKHTASSIFSTTTCQTCHSTDTWANAKFDHSLTGFILSGGHSSPPRECADCHKNNNYNLPVGMTCVQCHQNDYNNTSNPSHAQQPKLFPTTCDSCHTTQGWQPAKFDHSLTPFPLTGLHMVPPRACTDCHTNNNYNIVVTTCISCHHTDFNNASNPNHVKGGFPQTCEVCHTTTGWSPANFDHSKTAFPLTGMHVVPPRQCADCHINGNYNLTTATCVSCHLTNFNNAANPNHVTGNFPQTCEVCHSTSAWQPAQFDHSKTNFPLTGLHTVPPRACTDCHVNNNYNLTGTECVTCHQTDYNNAKTPVDHVTANFPTTCANCHDTSAWTNGKFDHASTGWALTNSHMVPPRTCADCHTNGNYNLSSTTCITCHQADYNNAKTPVDHVSANFPTTCEGCHDTIHWTDGVFDHASTGWALTGLHTVPPRACSDCHTNGNYHLTATTCVTCHQTNYNNTTNPNHAQQGIPTTCEVCHTTGAWQPAQFDHAKSGFPLVGTGHTVPPRACTDCHVNNNYNITDTSCVSCHQTDYNNAKTPVDHAGANFPLTCANCHDTNLWTNGKFDHASTGWALTNSHMVPPRTCTDCHTNGNYNITVTTCISCHQIDYNNAKTPVDHVSANFPTACEGCHDTIHWTDGKFDHASTGWPLTNTHAVPPRSCADCHVNGNYSIKTTTCVSCHQTDYNNALTPVNHPQANFPLTCDTCHDTIHWTDGKFDHAATGWPLTASHMVPPRGCADCHVNGNYNITVTTCISCHQTAYNNAKTPVDHIAAKFPTTCETCHDTNLWTDAVFNHASTGWALVGTGHTVPPRACSDCHINGNYSITVTTCVSCHQTDYNNALTPVNHPQANFPLTCDTCHDTNLWTNGKFDHASTGWALVGTGHTVPPRLCSDCHVSGNYNLTSTTCITCHQTDYNNAKTPVDHVAAKFPTACEGCHDTNLWTNGVFNHASTGWALTNSHMVPPRACSDCHINGNYNITSTTCISCHQTDYNNAKTPVDHVTANFPTTCETCHDTIHWTDGKFDHAATGWALVGAGHTAPPRLCTDCHVNNNYNLTSAACVNCHQTNYNNTTTPPHAQVGFPTTCDTCHDTVAWTDAVFDHSKTSFPLTNAHLVPPRTCVQCHVNNNYLTLPTDCYGCHAALYSSTTNPNHASAGFPTTCATCHTTIAWTGATFNHTWFNMNHGNANGVCATCHTNPNDYSVFQCTGCHGNNNSNNFNHPNVNGYVYNSVNCYACHKGG